MTTRCTLVLDLDGTLLHTQPAPDPIVVPGRTRPAFLAANTVQVLAALGTRFDIILATGRSWAGTQPVVDGLQQRDVAVAGLVLEDGGLLGLPGALRPLEPHHRWADLRAQLDLSPDPTWPPFEWQHDFESCLVARAEHALQAEALRAPLFARAQGYADRLRVYRDGRKVYLAGARADKWWALQALVGPCVQDAWGIGDGLNDLCWLPHIRRAGVLAHGAPEVVAAVLAGGGIASSRTGHDGIVELLEQFLHISQTERGLR